MIKNLDKYFVNSFSGNVYTLIIIFNNYNENSTFFSGEMKQKISGLCIGLMDLVNTMGSDLTQFLQANNTKEDGRGLQMRSGKYQYDSVILNYIKPGVVYKLWLSTESKDNEEANVCNGHTVVLYLLNPGTILNTDCSYKSVQLVKAWNHENFFEPLLNVKIEEGSMLLVCYNRIEGVGS